MNLKFRNILISVGVVSLIGIATAGLIVSIQTHKEAQKDKDTKEMLSRPEIFKVIGDGLDIISSTSKTHLNDPSVVDLQDTLKKFRQIWIPNGRPDEQDFDEKNKQLEPLLTHLRELVDEMQGSTISLNAHDVQDVINEGWELYINVPIDQRQNVNATELKESLRNFEAVWETHDCPAQIEFADLDKRDHEKDPTLSKSKDLVYTFGQLTAMIDLMYNPTME